MRKKFIVGLLFCSLCTGILLGSGSEAATKKVKLNTSKKTLDVGKTLKLKVKNLNNKKAKITWKSSKKKIASVNKRGVIKAIKPGKAIIKATIKQKGKKAIALSCAVTVKKKSSAKPAQVSTTNTPNVQKTTAPIVSAAPVASVTPTVQPTTAPTSSPTPVPTVRPPHGTLSGFMANAQNPNYAFDSFSTFAPSIKTPGENNPVSPNSYMADPTAISYNGRMYVYMTNDQQNYEIGMREGGNDYKNITSIRIISTDDMVNWQDHGVVNLTGETGICSSYAGEGSHSWAPSVVYRNENGKDRFYMYYTNNGTNINVVVADSPTGPFRDEIGKPLIEGWRNTNNTKEGLDPGVFIDDDGTAYLAYGYTNRGAGIIQLGSDMMSTVGKTVSLKAPAFFEDSELNKIGDTYYYSYCSDWNTDDRTGLYSDLGQCHIAYMTSKSPMGPYTYAGDIFDNAGDAFGTAANNHHHMIEFKGTWYMLYHTLEASQKNKNLNDDDTNRGHRNLQINSFTFNADGSIGKINQDMVGATQIQSFDPYKVTSGTVYSDCAGAITNHIREDKSYEETPYFEPVTNENYTYSWNKVSNADFGDGSDKMTFSAEFDADTTLSKETSIKVMLDSLDGTTVLDAKITPDNSGRATINVPVDKITGVHDVYFVFDGHVVSFNSWAFTK